MDLKHSTDMTASAETVIHGSKSTDFIKPKGSSTNLEAQNPGTISLPHPISELLIRNRLNWAFLLQFVHIFFSRFE